MALSNGTPSESQQLALALALAILSGSWPGKAPAYTQEAKHKTAAACQYSRVQG